MRSLEGKVAWVTGAGSGIGEAGARALADAGMHVVLSGRRAELLDALAADLGERVSTAPLDVSDRDRVGEVAAGILARHGRMDVLVNSAGINVKSRNWHNVSLDDWDRIIRIDLDGAFYCAKSVLPNMIEQGDGLIINISSWAGPRPSTP
jgi:NADP-dependent 3-hydroxy acid dehydrogenase YdfG